jgi:hypothetical protein
VKLLPQRRLSRPLAAFATLGVAVVTVSGCVIFKVGSSNAEQLNQIGNVRLTTTICASGTTDCAGQGNAIGNAIDSTTGQVLIGYQIPTTATEPATLPLTDPVTSFTPSLGYASELQRLLPAPTGQKWVGYISAQGTFSSGALAPKSFEIKPEFVSSGQRMEPHLLARSSSARWSGSA